MLAASHEIGEMHLAVTYPVFMLCQEDHLRMATPAPVPLPFLCGAARHAWDINYVSTVLEAATVRVF
jgi:hypothetical protein